MLYSIIKNHFILVFTLLFGLYCFWFIFCPKIPQSFDTSFLHTIVSKTPPSLSLSVALNSCYVSHQWSKINNVFHARFCVCVCVCVCVILILISQDSYFFITCMHVFYHCMILNMLHINEIMLINILIPHNHTPLESGFFPPPFTLSKIICHKMEWKWSV
jgi:hypothetical protein